jgi:hypothetical protein
VKVQWSEDFDIFFDRLVNALAQSRDFRDIDTSAFSILAGMGQISGFRVEVSPLGKRRERILSETSIPSFSNSPWMRGAPHSGLACAICRIKELT